MVIPISPLVKGCFNSLGSPEEYLGRKCHRTETDSSLMVVKKASGMHNLCMQLSERLHKYGSGLNEEISRIVWYFYSLTIGQDAMQHRKANNQIQGLELRVRTQGLGPDSKDSWERSPTLGSRRLRG